MRNNNLFYRDYLEQLAKENISIEQELSDVNDTLPRGPVDDRFGRWLDCWMKNEPLRIPGRKKAVDLKEELGLIACDCVEAISEISRKAREEGRTHDIPIEGTNSYCRVTDYTDEEDNIMAQYHWCYIELETVLYRMTHEEVA